jgi:predicted nucleic acid-binding protein
VLFLLDTTVLIDFLRGKPATQRVLSLRSRGDQPCTTGVNVEEVARGLRTSEDHAATQLMRGLLILPLGLAEGWRAGEWRRQHAARGVTLAQADCLIAAAAEAASAVLATGNPKDFPMRGLRVEHWPVGQ